MLQYISHLPVKASNKICIYIGLKTQKRSLPHAAALKLYKNNNLLSIYPLFKWYFPGLTSRLKTSPDIKDFEISYTAG